jgi:hypothetical protein
MAYALGLIGVTVAAAVGSRGSKVTIATSGFALGCSVAFNPFVGAVFALAYGVGVALDAVRYPRCVEALARHAIAVVPVGCALAWCWANQMVEGAGGALQFGFEGTSTHAPLLTLMLSLGPVLLPALAGLAPDAAIAFSPAVPATTVALVSLVLLYFVRLSVDDSWVGFRAGQMMLVSLPALLARIFERLSRGRLRVVLAAGIAAILTAGLPTTVIDAYNAQDITNFNLAAWDAPWTVMISPEQQQAFRWIRQNTAPTALVQMDPTIRQRSTWSLIPSLAERRMAAGLPISLLDIPDYHEHSERVRVMYDTASAEEAWHIARGLRIDYIYADQMERSAHAAAAKFDISPDFFTPVFRLGPVAVYRVK